MLTNYIFRDITNLNEDKFKLMLSTIINKLSVLRMFDLSCVQAANTFTELNEMVRFAKQYRVTCRSAMPYYTE